MMTRRTIARYRFPENLSIPQARQLQEQLARQVILEDQFTTPKLVAGIDVGFPEKGRLTRAAIAVLTFPELHLLESAVIETETVFPYVPGYLSFRELPAILIALEKLDAQPDIFLCDGQGIAHPRRLGIASHLGVILDMPTIGVAKSRLIGTYKEPGKEKGAHTTLYDNNDKIGAVLRTRTNVKPLFVSPGHKISIPTAIKYTLACTTRFRLPETTRYADKLASGYC